MTESQYLARILANTEESKADIKELYKLTGEMREDWQGCRLNGSEERAKIRLEIEVLKGEVKGMKSVAAVVGGIMGAGLGLLGNWVKHVVSGGPS
jgi:hypothetical protein